jgi:hypothetical protein
MATLRNMRGTVSRSAFTLLEMILATAICLLLLAALYVAVDLQLRHASDARDVIEQTTLARTLLSRIAGDIAPGIATADPTRYQQSGQSKSGGSGGTGATGGTANSSGGASSGTPSTGNSNSGSGGTNANSGGNSQGSVATTTTTTVNSFTPGGNGGSAVSSPNGLAVLALQGSSDSLTLYVTRVPADPTTTQNVNNDQAQLPGMSDMRRVVYWLAPGEGLARQEIGPVTSDDAQNGNVPSGAPDPSTRQLLAKEVRSLQFRYFDGTDWKDSWDGTQPGPDGMTPIGPPVLVEITIGLELPNSDQTKTYKHVVSIPTANGVNAQQQSNSTDTGNGSSGSGSGSGSSSGTGSGQ